MNYALINNLKSEGKNREAGQIARLIGSDSNLGCHFGMRSELEQARHDFRLGWQEVDAALSLNR